MTTVGEFQGYGDAVSTPHVLATQSAMEILAAGGTAADALITADAVLGVVAPETCGIGGDMFALVWTDGAARPTALNASGWAGTGADADALRRAGHTSMPPFHPQSVTVPGCVAGWGALHERYGRLPLESLLGSAIRLAESGFPASTELSGALTRAREQLETQEATIGLFPAGRPPRRGEKVSRPGLAATLRAIAEQGPEAFYTGAVATDISKAVDGVLEPADLEAYRPDWVEPIAVDVFGTTGWTIPPNSQGYLTLATAGIFERTDPPSDADDPEWWHLLIESYRVAVADRDDLLADPRHVPPALMAGLEPAALASKAASIDRGAASARRRPNPVPGGTAYFCAVDREGMAVSFIQSNFMGIGSRIGVGPHGFLLHNRGAGFDLRNGHPNELSPGKRPLHTLAPSLWTRDGRVVAVLGTRGGHQQPQMLAQVAARHLGLGAGPAEAQRAPRWTIDLDGRDEVRVESRTPPEVVSGLESRGHTVVTGRPWEGGWGPISLIAVGPDGLRTAAADPRVDTASAAVRG